MTSVYFGVIMFICVVPALLITYFQLYPRNWKEDRLIFGVNNREEFRVGEAGERVGEIVQKYRGQARAVLIVSCVIAVVLLLLHGVAVQTFLWCTFTFAAIFAGMVPFLLGHREMMALKRSLGLSQEKGVLYVDLKNAGNVRALKHFSVLAPNLVGLALVFVVLAMDLGVIETRSRWVAGSFWGTIFIGTFWLTGVVITGVAFLLDRMKNEVISRDSDVNANYNRAKKKNMARMNVAMLWINVGFTFILTVGLLLFYSDGIAMLGLGAYLVLLMAEMAVYVRSGQKIEARYHKEIEVIPDDDENWLGGMFYYNPSDKRLNVEKRVGMGGTINLAHPMGKVISALLALSIVAAMLSVIWIGMVEATPLQLQVADGRVICHQLWDDYVIPVEELQSVSWGEDVSELVLVRISGVGMDTLLKGNFSVNGENGCKVFLAPEGKAYLKLVTKSGKTYYVSGADAGETRAAYEAIREAGR